MYVKTENDTERPLVLVSLLEDIPGGGVVENGDFKSGTLELKEGAVLGKDANGIWHLCKTAKIVEGGSNSAPRINKAHEFKVGDVISDKVVGLTIASITEGTTYDTLAFSSGTLTNYAVNTLLYQIETEDTTGTGTAATAVVTGDVADTLTVTIPVKSNPANFNGITVEISQAANDTLAVTYSNGKLSIALAKTTASKNNAATIQAAVRALGVVASGIDFSLATVTGAAGWDGAQTGAVLTVPADDLGGGVNYGAKPYKYTPAGISMNTVDLTNANPATGILVRGTVKEVLLPYFADSTLKGLLPLIRFV